MSGAAQSRNGNPPSWSILGVSAAAFCFVVTCLAAKLFLDAGWGWRCPVIAVLHLPCPSCGSTRALAALGEFRWIEALRFNPLLVMAIVAGPILFSLRTQLARYSRAGWPLFVAAVLLNWFYLYLFLLR